LERFAVLQLDADRLVGGEDPPVRYYSDGYLAEEIGVSRRELQRWKTVGVPEHWADRAAVALGQHPFAIWGFEWLRDVEPVG
jgi:hypothetical protein